MTKKKEFNHKQKTVNKLKKPTKNSSLIEKVRYFFRAREHKPMRRVLLFGLIPVVTMIGIFSYLTNPFVRFSLIQDPQADVQLVDNQFQLQPEEDVFISDGSFVEWLAKVKSAWHILVSKFGGSKKAPQSSVEEIIRSIHELRFDPSEPFLISGDHFSVFYPRSLGIFYHSTLDPRTALDEQDWHNRQLLYLKSTSYALRVFSESDILSTTIVPVSPRSVVLVNIYAPASDTLYSLLYGLTSLLSTDEIEQTYPYQVDSEQDEGDYPLQTVDATEELLNRYSDDLTRHWQQYKSDVFDETTGLIRQDILLSSTKDMAKRESAFYDNVIFWKTAVLGQQLGIIGQEEIDTDELKETIISTFWYESRGYFIEDLSKRGKSEKLYSSDWIIAYQTGFLDPENDRDLPYLLRSVDYINRNAIDQPFGLQYSPDQRPWQLHSVVRFSAPEYGSTAIWSNWGMEYIKLLTHLHQVTQDQTYLNRADQQLSAYKFNIKRYRGYPELYDHDGDFFRNKFYTSVRQTGWVVSYEQAQAMFDWTRRQSQNVD